MAKTSNPPFGIQKRSGRPRRGAPLRRGYVKKKTKRGAYKKSAKSQMVIRRAPLVETKQRVHSDIATINGFAAGANNIVNPLNWRTLVVDDAFTNIPLKSWQRQSHGFEEYQCIGNSITSKFLNFKFMLRFPRGELLSLPDPDPSKPDYNVHNKMIEHPTKVYLITGWITESMNYPLDNQPSPSLPAQSSADADALDTYITQQLKPFFDDDEDKLQFRPKTTTNIKIDRYVNLAPKLNQAIATQAVPSLTGTPIGTGSIPDVMKSWSVTTNRKIALTEGAETTFTTDKQNLYPNNSWVPFAVIYNPEYEAQAANAVLKDDGSGQFEQVQMMEYRWNDAHYYSDS